MPLSVVLLARVHKGAFQVGFTGSLVRLPFGGVEEMKNLSGMDEEEKHS